MTGAIRSSGVVPANVPVSGVSWNRTRSRIWILGDHGTAVRKCQCQSTPHSTGSLLLNPLRNVRLHTCGIDNLQGETQKQDGGHALALSCASSLKCFHFCSVRIQWKISNWKIGNFHFPLFPFHMHDSGNFPLENWREIYMIILLRPAISSINRAFPRCQSCPNRPKVTFQ